MSKIEWTDTTLNPGLYGCKEVSPACRNCYAAKMAHRQVAMGNYPDGITTKRASGIHWSGVVKVNFDAIGPAFAKLPKGRKRIRACVACEGVRHAGDICDKCGSVADGHGGFYPRRRRCFVTSMSDLFHEDVPFEFIGRVFAQMAARPHIHFQVLTKRPERMAEWGHRTICPPYRWPVNVWAGTTVEDQKRANERIPHLLAVPAAVRFLSCEPLCGPLDLDEWLADMSDEVWQFWGETLAMCHQRGIEARGIQWVLAGGESGVKASPSHPDWFRSLRDQCAEAGVPFLFKQWGEWAPFVAADYPRAKPFPKVGSFGADGWQAGNVHVDRTNMVRAGKKAAGRLLDGVVHDEFPA